MREKKDMLNFTVGPVMASDEICRIGAEQVPYFRTDEFSKIMKENETLVKKFSGAEEAGRVVFLTGSGTAAMEAAVINTLTKDDKVLVVNVVVLDNALWICVKYIRYRIRRLD